VQLLLEAGADPNLPDGESGWTALHRACYFGHLQILSLLLQAGGLLDAVDSKVTVHFLGARRHVKGTTLAPESTDVSPCTCIRGAVQKTATL